MEKKFKVGDRVVMTHNFCSAEVGMIGVVKHCWDSKLLAVEFVERFNGGHDCCGYCKNGHGHNVHVNQVSLLKSSTKYQPGDIVIVRSDLRIGYYKMESGGDPMRVTDQMLTKRGKKVKIKSVTKSGKYMIEGSIFPWTDEMFVDKSKVEPKKTEKVEKAKSAAFDWKAFERGKVIVHLDTAEKEKAFLKECEEHCLEWCNGSLPTKYFYYDGSDYSILYKYHGLTHASVNRHLNRCKDAVVYKYELPTRPTWTLTIRGEDDRTFASYVNNDLEATAEVSRFFEDQYSVRKAIEAVVAKVIPEEKWVVSVKFDNARRTYDYLTTDNTIKPGDKVVVATGSDNHHVVVTVTKIIPEKEYTSKGLKLKGIVRKCEAGEEPTYYNGKVVCTWAAGGKAYTVGKIYPVIEGKLILDSGVPFPREAATTFADLSDKLHLSANFVEIVE